MKARVDKEVAHLRDLRAADKDLAKERDMRYCERNKRQDDALKHLEDMHEKMRESDKEAVDKAFAAATELSKGHNDLLRKMEKLTETFATKESVSDAIERTEAPYIVRVGNLEKWQARLTGGLILLGALGVANLVRIFSG